MLTDEDIQKIVEANREMFTTKEDFENFREELRKSFSDLQTTVDAYAKRADTYFRKWLYLAIKLTVMKSGFNRLL